MERNFLLLKYKQGQGENELLKWLLIVVFLAIAGGAVYLLLKSLKVI